MPAINFPYTDREMTGMVNRVPNTFGLINRLGIFSTEPSATRFIEIRFEDGNFVVLAAEEPGASGQLQPADTGNSVIVKIPHFPELDTIQPQDMQDINDIVAGQKALRSFDEEVAKKLTKIRRAHAQTREYIRLGALKGLIKDGKGRTLYNLFTVFGITKKTIDFVLGTATTDIIAKCDELTQHMATNLRGETMSMPRVLVDGTFFNKLVQHARVEKYWLQQQAATQLANINRGPQDLFYGREFVFQNVVFQEYIGFMPVRDPGTNAVTQEKIITANMGHAYPEGTSGGTFVTYDGPVHHVDEVNKRPDGEVFITTKVEDHGNGAQMKSQSNVLAIVKRPELLVEVSTSN
jgi:hypothetical protein